MKFDNYSKGPWTECNDQVLDGDGFAILRTTENLLDKTQHRANVQRIVACVNACSGIPTEKLEAMATDPVEGMFGRLAGRMVGENRTLKSQRDELLAALERLLKWHDDIYGDKCDYSGDHPLAVARAGIDRAKGGAA